MIQVNKTTIPSLNSDSGYFVNSFNEMIIESGEKVPFENKRKLQVQVGHLHGRT
jgi:hypothetical protein